MFGLRAGVDNGRKACRIRALWWLVMWGMGQCDMENRTIQDYDRSKMYSVWGI